MTKSGPGSGSVASAPAGISCGATCTATFANGTSVTLTATPTGRSRFTGWSGDCSGTGTCVLAMTANHAATARFANPLAPPSCTVPKVVGMTVPKAKAKIVKAHCKLGTVTKKASSAKKKGKVIAQSVRPGKKLKNGARVNLTVGK